MRAAGITLIILVTSITLVIGQDTAEPKIFLGIGVSFTVFPYAEVEGLDNNSNLPVTGNIPITIGYVVKSGYQLQLEYYLEDYFQRRDYYIKYNDIIYAIPQSSFLNARALKLSFGKRLGIGNYLITPKGGITFGFLGDPPSSSLEIQGNLGGVNYTSKSEISEYNSFQPFVALGFDLESPKILKRFSVTVNGYYNFAIRPAMRTDISFEADGALVYANSLSESLNHGNMMMGLRYYFSL